MSRLIIYLHRFENGLLAIFLIVLISLACLQIVLRNFADTGLSWADPTLRVLVLWVGLLGALAASRSDNHISVDVVSRFLHGRSLVAIHAITCLFTTIVCALLAYHSMRFVWIEFQEKTIAFAGVPAWCLESILPVIFLLISLRYLLLSVHYVVDGIKGDPE